MPAVRLGVVRHPERDAEGPVGNFARTVEFVLSARGHVADMTGFVLQHVQVCTTASRCSERGGLRSMSATDLGRYTGRGGLNENYYEFFPVDRRGVVRDFDQFAQASVVPAALLGGAPSPRTLRHTTRGTLTMRGEAAYFQTRLPARHFVPPGASDVEMASGLVSCREPPVGLPDAASNTAVHTVVASWGDPSRSTGPDPDGDVYSWVQEDIRISG